MLRLPTIRPQLQQADREPLISLAEAYEDASATLELLRQSRNDNAHLHTEYMKLCEEIEAEVLCYCHSRS